MHFWNRWDARAGRYEWRFSNFFFRNKASTTSPRWLVIICWCRCLSGPDWRCLWLQVCSARLTAKNLLNRHSFLFSSGLLFGSFHWIFCVKNAVMMKKNIPLSRHLLLWHNCHSLQLEAGSDLQVKMFVCKLVTLMFLERHGRRVIWLPKADRGKQLLRFLQ